MRIKKFFSLVLLTLFANLSAQESLEPVLMVINNNAITKSDFEHLYHKNNSSNVLDKKTLKEYVDMFINFKLKVEDAKEEGLDTTEVFLEEFRQYRKELIKPYLTDKDTVERLKREAYERMKENVEVSHILVRLAPDADKEDQLIAWEKINSIKKKTKKQDFKKLAKTFSEDPSAAQNQGYIGWISAFSTVYPFESMAYSTAPGQISDVFRTSFGYHILKVHDRRKSPGKRLVSHIMTFTSRDDQERNDVAKNKIDSLYKRVLAGESFEALAKEFSEDKASAIRNGELPWFGVGNMIPEFEKAAFALEKPGDISKPIQSAYGWHIIKLLDTKETPSFQEMSLEIDQKIKRDERSSRGRDSFIEKLKKEYKVQIIEENLEEFILALEECQNLDKFFFQKIEKLAKPLFYFAEKEFTQKDFSDYLSQNAYYSNDRADVFIYEKLDDFLTEELLTYESHQVEKKDNNLRLLLQEYHDGILLFEISNKKVWDKAMKDSVGITNYFNENKEAYRWAVPHYKGSVIYCKDKATKKKAKRFLKKKSIHADSIASYLNEHFNDSVLRVKVEKGLFAKGENKIIDKEIFKSKENYLPNEEFPFVFVVGKKLKYTPESPQDVLGLVLADYQNFLEQEWVNFLRNKYTVQINEDELKKVKEY